MGMIPRVIKIELLNDYNIFIEFNNGTKGVVDFREDLESDHRQIVRDVLNMDMFKTVKIDGWSLSWDNEYDICPNVLHEMVQEANARRVAEKVA